MSNKEHQKEIFSSINCLKAVGAFLVVWYHCYQAQWGLPLIRTAVPLFFMISGFFLYREEKKAALNKCKSSLIRIFWLTLYANVFYWLLQFQANSQPSETVIAIPFNSLKSFVNYILWGYGFQMHLWYLNAYIETLIIVWIFKRFLKLSWLWSLIPVFVVIGILSGTYSGFFGLTEFNSLNISRNFITMGIPCFGIGWLLRKYQNWIMNKIKGPTVIFLIVFVLAAAEIFLVLTYTPPHPLEGDIYFFTYPLTALLLVLGIKYPFLGKGAWLEKVGRRYSLYIYVFHIFVLSLVRFVDYKMCYKFLKDVPGIVEVTTVLDPFVVFLGTIVFVFVWKKASKYFFTK